MAILRKILRKQAFEQGIVIRIVENSQDDRTAPSTNIFYRHPLALSKKLNLPAQLAT